MPAVQLNASSRFAAVRRGELLCLAVACLALVAVVPGCGSGQSTDRNTPGESSSSIGTEPRIDRIQVASRAMAANDLESAEKALREQLVENPKDARAFEMLGDLSLRRGQSDQAITFYREAIDQGGTPSLQLYDKLAGQCMRSGRPFDTLSVLQKAIETHQGNPQLRFDLAGLAAMLGDARSATPPLRWLAQHGQGDLESLILLADPARLEADESMCNLALQKYPADLRPQYSLARQDAVKMNWRAVAERLQPVVKQHPDFIPAQALYGSALIELDDFDAVNRWQQQLPSGIDQSPTYWHAAGTWALRQGKPAEAARAFWEAVRLDESGQPESLNQLLVSLKQIGRDDDASLVAKRMNDFTAMRDALATFNERKSQSQQSGLRVALAMQKLGRIWEAEAWARLAASLPNDRVSTIREDYLSIRSQLSTQTPWQLAGSALAQQIDLSDLETVNWAPSTTASGQTAAGAMAELRFADQAASMGLVHTCEIAPEATTKGHWIYQSVGGGTGVIDFDLDGWPDLALAMLDGKPLKSDSKSNRLMRNVAGQFREVTFASGYVDHGFAQGIAVGDYNDDGFPDLFDANIGANRLFRNNGDGTFTDVSEQVGLSGQSWTTSAAIVDLDADGFADLFEVAYCGGSRPYTQPCRSGEKVSTCPPLQFEAEKDRVWRSRGDGTMEDVSAQWLDDHTPGRGLGLIVGDLDGQGGIDVLVANDMTVNHLWSGDPGDQGFRLFDRAATSGVAFNGRSFSQASMGMAAGDGDGDGDIDLFLTHFADDHNTYYEQVSPGLWVDRSYQVGLAEPSMKLLGFGTELADFDNNGTLELIVANGHVDEVDRTDIAYHMPAQLFERHAGGRWGEHDRKPLGEYFQKDHLGRALVTLDVNRNGAIDCAITHLYEPVALLINDTPGRGNSIGLTLQATQGHRDAIGAWVTMNVGGRSVTHPLTAGDGYMCSNQRRISVGLGTMERASQIVVQWPSGLRESFAELAAGYDYLLVEGSGEPFALCEHHES